ncbi:hypothetical protein ACQJBY_044376 [Aegilops geniculata]
MSGRTLAQIFARAPRRYAPWLADDAATRGAWGSLSCLPGLRCLALLLLAVAGSGAPSRDPGIRRTRRPVLSDFTQGASSPALAPMPGVCPRVVTTGRDAPDVTCAPHMRGQIRSDRACASAAGTNFPRPTTWNWMTGAPAPVLASTMRCRTATLAALVLSELSTRIFSSHLLARS